MPRMRINIGDRWKLLDSYFAWKPISSTPDPRQIALVAHGDLAGWGAEDSDRGAHFPQEPCGAHQWVACEGRLGGWKENADGTPSGNRSG